MSTPADGALTNAAGAKGAAEDEIEPSDRVITWIALAAVPLCVGLGALQAFHYHVGWAGLLLLGCGAAFALTPLVRYARVSAMHWCFFVFWVAIGGTSYLRGGVILPILVFCVVPGLGAVLARRRGAALVWCASIVPLVVGLYALEHAGLAPPRVDASPWGALIGVCAGLLGAVAIIALIERARQQEAAEHAKTERALATANKLEGMARLAGGVAHDFNNLLAVVTAHAKVIEHGLDPAHEHQEDVAAIQDASRAGAELIRSLLAIGREDAAADVRAPLDLNRSVLKLRRLLGTTLPHHVELVTELCPEAPVVESNDRQVQQVLMNLVVNARDAMPRGGRVEVRTSIEHHPRALTTRYGELPPGRYAVLSVSDEGTGMSDELLDRVLEPFFTTKGRERGTGLGLAVVHGVVSSLGGHLDVRSREEEGTTFHVRLPLSEGTPERRSVPAQPSAAPRPARVLLVEDDAAVRRATERLLRLDGHRIVTASSGAQALELLSDDAASFDVLLTDVVMPQMSGRDLAARVRVLRPSLGILFVSGYSGDVLSEEDLASERVAFLQKPASRRALSATIEGLRGRGPAAPAGAGKLLGGSA